MTSFDDVEGAANSDVVHGLARFGLGARALVYLLLGVLAVLLALGERGGETDQRGALEELARHTGGEVLVWLIAAGLFAYALWRLKEAIFGVAVDGDGAGPRAKSAVRCIVYVGLGITAVDVAVGSRGSQSGQSKGITAQVLQHSGGRWLVGLAGLVVAAVGAVLVHEGVTRKFEKYFRLERMTRRERRIVELLGAVGTTARGIAVAIAGVLVVVAAVQADPDEAGGLDQALRKLAGDSAGAVVLVVIAAGLVAFGLFGFAEARWRRT